ncbi:hypothetical protein [Streptomyces sp. RKAG337]|uniref:hypothetical protein n=1 Tax=Streptomyces sp. RKAG337 TaxID=2893404 RepID=UPI0020336D20|nr:hypothetical protein [Streptomyces sp. RKAG337]MCM2431057.1 hypothetical protein [Streptomyces sp. RKAG337]
MPRRRTNKTPKAARPYVTGPPPGEPTKVTQAHRNALALADPHTGYLPHYVNHLVIRALYALGLARHDALPRATEAGLSIGARERKRSAAR